MAGKSINYGEDCRQAILSGVNKLADTVKARIVDELARKDNKAVWTPLEALINFTLGRFSTENEAKFMKAP